MSSARPPGTARPPARTATRRPCWTCWPRSRTAGSRCWTWPHSTPTGTEACASPRYGCSAAPTRASPATAGRRAARWRYWEPRSSCSIRAGSSGRPGSTTNSPCSPRSSAPAATSPDGSPAGPHRRAVRLRPSPFLGRRPPGPVSGRAVLPALRGQAADQVGHEGRMALGEGVGAAVGGGGDRGGVGVDRGGAGRGDEEEEQAAGVESGVEFTGLLAAADVVEGVPHAGELVVGGLAADAAQREQAGEVAPLLVGGDVVGDDLGERALGVVDALLGAQPGGADGVEQALLAAEVVGDELGVDPRLGGDAGDAGPLEAVPGELAEG